MLIPPPLPDELLIGYRARIATLNGPMSPAAFARELRAASGHSNPDIDSTCALVHVGAKAGRMSPAAFVDAHSCFRINCRPGDYLAPSELEAQLTKNRVAIVNSLPTTALRACCECVSEDLQTHRFSFWRRSHHIPGRYVCPRHGRVLRVFYEGDSIASMPEFVYSSTALSEDLRFRAGAGNPYIDRCVGFLDRIIKDRLVVDRLGCTKAIRKALLAQGEAIFSWGWSNAFALKVEKAYSTDASLGSLPTIEMGVDAIVWRVLRPMIYEYQHVTHVSLAILAGIAFSSVDAAMQEIFSAL